MSIALNSITIAGNLTRDPELKFLANDKTLAKLTIANSRRYKSGDETREETIFIDGEAWGRTAELIGKYFSKGKPIILQGSLKQDTWDDKETGKKRTSISIKIDQIHFVPDGRRQESAASEATSADPTATTSAIPPSGPRSNFGDDEPPF